MSDELNPKEETAAPTAGEDYLERRPGPTAEEARRMVDAMGDTTGISQRMKEARGAGLAGLESEAPGADHERTALDDIADSCDEAARRLEAARALGEAPLAEQPEASDAE